jgi:hypothetical protein
VLHVFDVLDSNDNLTALPQVRVFERSESPKWVQSKITFTRSLDAWIESTTLKYNGASIGEFQVHNNRNCFKFRFNLSGLMDAGLI